MGNFKLNLVCFVIRPLASDVPEGGEVVLFKSYLLCVILYYNLLPSLSLRLLQLSIAIGAVDYDDRMVFSLIPSCVLLAFDKINLT